MSENGNAQYGRGWLVGVTALAVASSAIGIGWGLPSRSIDKYLFGGGDVWSGEKIHRLSGAEAKLATDAVSRTGADVDVDPLARSGAEGGETPLTATDADVARIYLRYRLYTHQPDEMITMMALAGMRPARLQLDPRLYQYGGLFIYPVGALIGFCGAAGLIDVRGDVVHYLDHPDEFGKFYIVSRAYAAAWGVIGVLLVYAIARRLSGKTAAPGRRDESAISWHSTEGGRRAGLIAAILFTTMPAVVCMSHEGKPHLPGAALMLAAVWCAMRSLEPSAEPARGDSRDRRRDRSCEEESNDSAPAPRRRNWFAWTCVACGAAAGMVLSSWPIGVLIPLVAGLERRNRTGDARSRFVAFALRSALGVALAIAAYVAANPYVLINAAVNRDVLRSNFGNSLAMYEVSRIGEGLWRVAELTVEGATLPTVACGLIALGCAMVRRERRMDAALWALLIPAAVFFLQFAAIGAGKPAEYGRFGVFTNAALAIGAACLFNASALRGHWASRIALPGVVIAWSAAAGGAYLRNFHADATERHTRIALAETIREWAGHSTNEDEAPTVAVVAEPAPYGCPPLDFSRIRVVLVDGPPKGKGDRRFFLRARDLPAGDRFGAGFWPFGGFGSGRDRATPISWANKPFEAHSADGAAAGGG